jgi:hypothetical protein
MVLLLAMMGMSAVIAHEDAAGPFAVAVGLVVIRAATVLIRWAERRVR